MGVSNKEWDNILKCRYEISPPIWWTCPTHHQTSMFVCSVSKLCAADIQIIITYSIFFCIYHQNSKDPSLYSACKAFSIINWRLLSTVYVGIAYNAMQPNLNNPCATCQHANMPTCQHVWYTLNPKKFIEYMNKTHIWYMMFRVLVGNFFFPNIFNEFLQLFVYYLLIVQSFVVN